MLIVVDTGPDSGETAFTALYYSWANVPGVDGTALTVPACGHIAGVWARTDAERGVFKVVGHAPPQHHRFPHR
ncbi:hypothetical protein [Streptomyces sp. NPDC018045]|uniref:hypothetical protein n=1 Tax=Streptomyces sp. NPDC018045 TaxID=3365037 RepID=UPI0037ACC676